MCLETRYFILIMGQNKNINREETPEVIKGVFVPKSYVCLFLLKSPIISKRKREKLRNHLFELRCDLEDKSHSDSDYSSSMDFRYVSLKNSL